MSQIVRSSVFDISGGARQDAPSHDITVVLIRHALSQANQEHRFSGSLDVEATPEGLEQIRTFKRQGIYPHTQLHYSSPKRRCLATFEVAFGGRATLDGTLEDFCELHLGKLEGNCLTPDESMRMWDSWVQGTDHARSYQIESLEDGSLRGANAVRKLALLCEAQGVNSVSVITHSAIMRAALMRLANLETRDWMRLVVPNGLGYVLSLKVDSTGQVCFNRAVPLDPVAPSSAYIYPRVL